jgi:ABC-type Fe3+ transport system permease subunit
MDAPAPPRAPSRTALASACLLLLVLAATFFAARWARGPRDRFYTLDVVDEPTRPDVAYTGTVPFGTWGALPWAVAAVTPQ